MSTTVFATKGNLISTQRSLALAKTGYELMDKKRNILIREMMLLVDKVTSVQSEIDKVFSEAYASLIEANLSSGVIQSIAEAVPEEKGVRVRTKSVMGVEVPIVTLEERREGAVPYGLSETDSALDIAYSKFAQVKDLCVKLAEIENSVYRLAIAIKKTQRRANSLKNIVIPRQEATVKFIVNTLEEKEREEFSRMKIIKNRKDKEKKDFI
ncbi:MAG: V-type ATP synthase subunit D [Eubacteriales bacterium]|nr:V-type ATP synthase subunit D [Clostridiales bacterium]MDD7393736.1 V-type ATP synthase subunit D [Eubacteriales bacterium]MDY3760506.1 V-type ATP synthase subunit D [Eubacteriales bacterium]